MSAAFRFVLALIGLLPLLIALPGCGGAGGPSEQAKPELAQLSGTATDGKTVFTAATAKGTLGQPRTSFPVSETTDYRVSVVDLDGPYMVNAGTEFSVATGQGTTNATPLTTLLVAALFGQDGDGAFTAYGPTNPALSHRVTDDNIAHAQAATLDFVVHTLGVPVPASIGNFITTPFKPAAGDPMYELILALDTKAAALGPDAYGALVSAFVNHARLCLAEKLTIAVGDQSLDFCPSTKSATPEDADTTVLDYVFTTDTNDVLSLRVRDSSVLSAAYSPAAGGSYACSGTGCSTITLGTPAADLTRSLDFAATPMTGSSGMAVLSGSLTGAIPGVVLPVLPCSDNRFFLIKSDRSVSADCVDINIGSQFFGLPGTLGTEQGITSLAVYQFVNTLGSNGSAPQEPPMAVFVTLDGSTVVSVNAFHLSFDPATGLPVYDPADLKCRGSACQGVSVSPPTINTDQGYNVEVRTITLDNTPLAAVNPDGRLSSTVGATIKGSFSALYASSADLGAFYPPAPGSCTGLPQSVAITPADENFAYCMNDGNPATTAALPNGDLVFVLSPFFSSLTLTTDSAGIVKSVRAATPGFENFGCAGDCSGVTVSAPDASGNRSISFANVLLHVNEPDGFPTGARTAIASGSFDATPAVADPAAASRQRQSAQRVPLPLTRGRR